MLDVLFHCGFLALTSPSCIGETYIHALVSCLFQESHGPLEMSGVMYAIELVEGKDHPHQMGAKEFSNLGGKTLELLIRLTRHLWNTGKVVVVYSGFCVAKALTQLARKDVFGSALIKKRRYWPKNVNSDMIKAHFKESAVGHTDGF